MREGKNDFKTFQKVFLKQKIPFSWKNISTHFELNKIHLFVIDAVDKIS
jgi:hypothetical protein